MKILLWIIGAVLALLVGAALLLPILIDEKSLIEIASRQVEEQSGIKVSISGEASFSLFPKVALSTSGVLIEMPDGSARIEADYLQAGVALLPLLRSSIEMDSITVDGLTLTSVAANEQAARTAEVDTSTLSPQELDAFYAAREQLRESAQADAAAAAMAAPLALEVGSLSLRNIRSRTVDRQGNLISEVELAFLTGEDLNTAGRPIPLTAQVLIPGDTPDDTIEITIAGSATADVAGERATLDDFNIVVSGATPEPVELTLSGVAALDTQVTDLTVGIRIGDMSGTGTARYAALETPMIDANLTLTELNPALLVLAGPEAAAATEATESQDGAEDVPLPLHALRMIDTRAKLAIDTVVLGAHRLESVKAELRVVDGVVTLRPVTATLHGGAIAFEAQLDGHYNTAKLSTKGGVTDFDVGRAVAALETGLAASGVAGLNWSLNGAGTTSAELTRSLTGPIDFDTDDITLEGFAMEQMFCEGVALVNQESLVAEFPQDTRFEALSAKVQLSDGVARLDPLTAKLAAASLSGNGTLDIESQDLRASIRAQLSAELGELDPACRINERYTQLRWPVECSGNLTGDPASWCGIDTAEIIKDLAENEAKRRVEDEAGKLLNKLFKKD